MEVSTALLDAMGFKNGLEVEAVFNSVNIYSLSGINCTEHTLQTADGNTSGGNGYRMALGFSVNKTFERLFGDALADDEDKWREKHACRGPYLIVAVSVPPAKRVGRVKDDVSCLTTYDMFSPEKLALVSIEEDVLPRVVTSVTQLISAAGYTCTARHVSREVFGRSPAFRLVRDIRISFGATGSVSRRVGEEVIRNAVIESTNLADRLDPKVTRFLRLAEDEVDPLRRFLFFFLSVEVETHRSFAAIDHAKQIPSSVDPSFPYGALMLAFLEEQPSRLKTLKDRFVWCAMFAWPGMSNFDVHEFARLKSTRDKLSHGEITAPPAEAVAAVEALARKLQRYRIATEANSALAKNQ